MKKLVLALAMVLGATNINGQNLSDDIIMTQLPRTSDDFQKYQFDYKLECATDVGYDYTIFSTNSTFDGTGIFTLEHNETPIREIKCVVHDIKEGRYIPTYELDAKFSSSGKLASYNRSISSTANYRFGSESWSKGEWNKGGIVPCIPNAYAYWTSPTRNSKGLIVSVGDELKYKYDSQDRVIEVTYRDNEFVFLYTYVDYSKNIKTITVNNAKGKKADATYSYTNGMLTGINCNIYNSGGRVETHYEKSYKYNSHNDVSEIDLIKTNPSTFTTNYKFDNQYDSKGRLLVSNVSYFKDKMRGRISHTRKYTYDDKGNWIKIEQENQYGQKSILKRTITYGKSKADGIDINNIYDDEEVDTHANFGMTLKEALEKNEISFGRLWPETAGLLYNIRVVVRNDGAVGFYNESHTNKDRLDGPFGDLAEEYIKKLPWVPATINGTMVSSIVTLSWKYNYSNNKYSRTILKDVMFTNKERESYADLNAKIETLYSQNAASKEEGLKTDNPRDIATEGMSYVERGQKATQEGKDGTQFFKKADELFEKASTMDKAIANSQVILTKWVETKVYLNDLDNAVPKAAQLLKLLTTIQVDSENELSMNLLSYVTLCGYYETISNMEALNRCNEGASETAKKILTLNPNNSMAKSVLDYLKKN